MKGFVGFLSKASTSATRRKRGEESMADPIIIQLRRERETKNTIRFEEAENEEGTRR